MNWIGSSEGVVLGLLTLAVVAGAADYWYRAGTAQRVAPHAPSISAAAENSVHQPSGAEARESGNAFRAHRPWNPTENPPAAQVQAARPPESAAADLPGVGQASAAPRLAAPAAVPYALVGRIEHDGQEVIVLARGKALHFTRGGQGLDGDYRLETTDPPTLRHIPSGSSHILQSMASGSPPADATVSFLSQRPAVAVATHDAASPGETLGVELEAIVAQLQATPAPAVPVMSVLPLAR